MAIDLPTKLQARDERKTRKREHKKEQIALSAMQALGELGFANTSLRDIATQAGLSLGMLHYYFEDRTELIIQCVTMYKAAFTSQLRDVVDNASSREQVIDVMANALVTTIVEDAPAHRLWYDIRAQSLFNPVFRPVVKDIESTLIDIVNLAACRAGSVQARGGWFGYALIEGMFGHQLQNQVTGTPGDRESLVRDMRAVLETIF